MTEIATLWIKNGYFKGVGKWGPFKPSAGEKIENAAKGFFNWGNSLFEFSDKFAISEVDIVNGQNNLVWGFAAFALLSIAKSKMPQEAYSARILSTFAATGVLVLNVVPGAALTIAGLERNAS